ncbi:DUF3800 domain-containing protein [Alkalicoccus luteus]|uniref:DUF3800 domain-containing protein n=1 Tax=Alkalicoccus luteus TaxID=1237094 RepID=A0A969PU40_9BACI|nr:DUF3800 domain-containing protein [Alkalicoccus luteus]NJP37938.1 DUF3800 domain-containing protein [Alkalicoccus luteus]
MGRKVILNFDESGNMGRQGRYFTIACIEAENTKPLVNIMKKTILKTIKNFPEYNDLDEIKASDSSPVVKEFFLRKIATKESIKIRYIVADLHHVDAHLKDDENLLYNYMLKLLVTPIAAKNDVSCLCLNLDKRTIKVKSTNSFEDYIKLQLNYEQNCNVEVEVNYIESHNSRAIQAADFVANAINAKYEYNKTYGYTAIEQKIVRRSCFPYKQFGK